MRIRHYAWLAPLLLFAACCNHAPQPVAANPVSTSTPVAADMSGTDLLAQGKYMLTIGGCNDCRT